MITKRLITLTNKKKQNKASEKEKSTNKRVVYKLMTTLDNLHFN